MRPGLLDDDTSSIAFQEGRIVRWEQGTHVLVLIDGHEDQGRILSMYQRNLGVRVGVNGFIGSVSEKFEIARTWTPRHCQAFLVGAQREFVMIRVGRRSQR